MARTNATNFSGGLQFPYATAGTDLFVKDDVQILAQAVDQHDHSTGKGLILGAGAIPAGSITSAMIVDGTIDTADLKDGSVTSAKIADGTITATDIANLTITQAQLAVGSVDSSKIVDGTIASADLGSNCVTQRGFAVGVTNNPTTTSTSFVDLTDMLVSLTLDTTADLLIELNGPFSASAAGTAITIAVQVDGGADLAQVFGYAPNVTYPQVISNRWLFTAAGPGAHSVRGRWATSGGTATANNIGRTLTVVAFKH